MRGSCFSAMYPDMASIKIEYEFLTRFMLAQLMSVTHLACPSDLLYTEGCTPANSIHKVNFLLITLILLSEQLKGSVEKRDKSLFCRK